MEVLVPTEEKTTEVAARVEDPRRGGSSLPAQIFSGVVTVLVLSFNAYFQYHGKNYEIPEMAWSVILAPWLGDGAGKIADIMKKLKRKK